ncbi:MAG: family 10 glycosylhydrolase [Bacteroidota bacterium]
MASCSSSRYLGPSPEAEFRGVWIATVVNIDWPKNADDNVTKQKKDFIDLLEFYQNLNFNAVIVQVRTAGDAFYPTELAPWSKYLTGKQGRAPADSKDPLKWMIEETHIRDMEFHAWLNPYRATFDLDTLGLDTSHDFFQHRDWMVRYGKKFYYNPGLPQVRNKFSKVVQELVENYDIDAIHFDDYFYPYKIKGETFTDSLDFQTYGLPEQSLADWRRSNVDSLVAHVHRTIKKRKPWVQFGISPFGVWRNKSKDSLGSDTQAGQTTYDDLYANPLLWAEKGWVDYLAPQAYWSMDYPPASYRNVATWWASQKISTKIYLGNGAYKIKNNADKAWNRKNEIPEQLQFTRGTPELDGNIFFSAKSLKGQHEKVVKKIKKWYASPVINPTLKTSQNRILAPVKINSKTVSQDTLEIKLAHFDSIPRYLLYYLEANKSSGDKILFKKSYLSAGQENIHDKIAITGRLKRKTIQILVQDIYGNKTPSLMLNPKQL